MGTRTTTQGSTLAFRSQTNGVRPKILTKVPKEGVHVQVGYILLISTLWLKNFEMETFQTPVSEDKATFVEYDAAGQMGKHDSYDPESQAIHGEFKRPPY